MADFETEKYRFWFYQDKDKWIVYVDVATVEGRDITDEDVAELNDFFMDMGKWETFVKAGKSLLGDLGVYAKGEKEHEKEFGIEKYVIPTFEKKKSRLAVTIKLKPEESLRRTKGDTKWDVLPVGEIVEQIKNVPKWQTLRKAVLELKSQL